MLNRSIPPALAVEHMKTFQVLQPRATHFRDASCAEVECEAHRCGWITMIDVSTDLGGKQANYIRLHSGRAFTASELGTMVSFTFPAGQTCFAGHQVPVGRPEIYREIGGDFRGNPRGIQPITLRPEDWVDKFANHQDGIKTIIERG